MQDNLTAIASKDITVGEIVKDENNILLISIREFHGHKYCDIRKWFRNGKGHLIATNSGITVSRKSIDEFIMHIKNARVALSGEEAF